MNDIPIEVIQHYEMLLLFDTYPVMDEHGCIKTMYVHMDVSEKQRKKILSDVGAAKPTPK